ncbi:hypothetical protein B484DRAFT_395094 [Ochromonadaceae sp. CCMP2298]|nr:hypothetical protein B484DRAFT_395094 [Ochromonadaceae sp. CCMP2298]
MRAWTLVAAVLGLIYPCACTGEPLISWNVTLPTNQYGTYARLVVQSSASALQEVEVFCVRFSFQPTQCDRLLHSVTEHTSPRFERAERADGDRDGDWGATGDFCHHRPAAPVHPSDGPLVTAIIHSTGQLSLLDTLVSLDAQQDRDFEAVLLLDGVGFWDLPPTHANRPWLCHLPP